MNFVVVAEICDHLESVVDRFEDVWNEINALIVDRGDRALMEIVGLPLTGLIGVAQAFDLLNGLHAAASIAALVHLLGGLAPW